MRPLFDSSVLIASGCILALLETLLTTRRALLKRSDQNASQQMQLSPQDGQK